MADKFEDGEMENDNMTMEFRHLMESVTPVRASNTQQYTQAYHDLMMDDEDENEELDDEGLNDTENLNALIKQFLPSTPAKANDSSPSSAPSASASPSMVDDNTGNLSGFVSDLVRKFNSGSIGASPFASPEPTENTAAAPSPSPARPLEEIAFKGNSLTSLFDSVNGVDEDQEMGEEEREEEKEKEDEEDEVNESFAEPTGNMEFTQVFSSIHKPVDTPQKEDGKEEEEGENQQVELTGGFEMDFTQLLDGADLAAAAGDFASPKPSLTLHAEVEKEEKEEKEEESPFPSPAKEEAFVTPFKFNVATNSEPATPMSTTMEFTKVVGSLLSNPHPIQVEGFFSLFFCFHL